MAALIYTATTFDVRIPTAQFLPTPASINSPSSLKGSTDRLEATARGRLWTGASWPLIGYTNQDRITASYYDEAKEIRGFVQDGSGAGIDRMVIAISQVTQRVLGSVVSDPGTGAFVLQLITSDEGKVTVIAIPNDGDSRNIVAFRDIVPVAHA